MPPRRSSRIRVAVVLAAALTCGLALSEGRGVDAGGEAPISCPAADIQTIQLDAPARIDGVRVLVSHRSPVGGAALVRVDAGASDRVVEVRGAISKQLEFSPAMIASEVDVSLDPVFEAPRGACVRRIELLSGGAPIASVEPR